MGDRPTTSAERRLLSPALLLLLAEEPSHGYVLEERLAPLMRTPLSAGSVYRELRRLEASGAVTSAWEMADDRAGPRRRYQVTAFGMQRLEQAVGDMASLLEALDHLLLDR